MCVVGPALMNSCFFPLNHTYQCIQLEVPILHFLWGKEDNLYLNLDNKLNDYRLRVLMADTYASPSFALWGSINLTQNEANSLTIFFFCVSAQIVLFCRTDVGCRYKSFQFLMTFRPMGSWGGGWWLRNIAELWFLYPSLNVPINSEEAFPSNENKHWSQEQSENLPFHLLSQQLEPLHHVSSFLTFNPRKAIAVSSVALTCVYWGQWGRHSRLWQTTQRLAGRGCLWAAHPISCSPSCWASH